MQVFLLGLGVIAIALLVVQDRDSNVGISAVLMGLWAWQALAYHLAFFTAINPLAYVFAALFLCGAAVIFWQGVVWRKMNFGITSGWRMWPAWGLMIFAFAVYPAWTYLAGRRCPAFPTFGLPCPTPLFTLGLLAFLVKPYPRSPFVVPVLWCFVGRQVVFVFDVQADLGLLLAGVIGIVLLICSKPAATRLVAAS